MNNCNFGSSSWNSYTCIDSGNVPNNVRVEPRPTTSNSRQVDSSMERVMLSASLCEVALSVEDGNVNLQSDKKKKKEKNEDNWKRNRRKRLRNSGQAYETRTGDKVPEKKVDKDFDCHCTRKCREKVTADDLQHLFNSFWSLGDYTQQNAFLRQLVERCNIKRHRPRNGSKSCRHHTFLYFFKIKEKRIQVCKKLFLYTFQIGWGRVYKCALKDDLSDGRGKHTPANKIDDTEVINHIRSFPACLNPELNVAKMYQLYVDQCQSERKTPVNKTYYAKVFRTKFNLHFKPPWELPS